MKGLFENWRRFLNERIDFEVLQKIQENVIQVLEIEVRRLYSSSVINESGGMTVKAQLIGAYTDKLMEMIRERWKNSNENKYLQEMGYHVQIISGDDQVGKEYFSVTKDLL